MKDSFLLANNVTLITAIYLNLSCKDNLALNIKQGCWWTIKSLTVFIFFLFLYLLFSMLSRRSCVLRDIFFPTYSYIFFQWKIFQICPQDFRLFIPPHLSILAMNCVAVTVSLPFSPQKSGILTSSCFSVTLVLARICCANWAAAACALASMTTFCCVLATVRPVPEPPGWSVLDIFVDLKSSVV